MSNSKIKSFQNKLLKLKECTRLLDKPAIFYGHENFELPCKTFDYVVIEGYENVLQFERIIDQIWHDVGTFFLHYTKKKLISYLLAAIYERDITLTEEVKEFYSELEEAESVNYTIFKSIRGIELSEGEPVSFGSFKIYDRDKHRELMGQDHPRFKSKWEEVWDKYAEQYVICTDVCVRDLSRGYELADLKFRKLENVFSFLYQDFSKNTKIEISEKTDFEHNRFFAVNDSFSGGHGSVRLDGYNKANLNNVKLDSEKIGTKQLFQLIDKSNLTEIERRVLLAIDWYGRGFYESDIDKAFIQLMFALEAILNYRDNSIVEPSILSRMSEFIALTIGESVEDRLKWEKEFKHLYGIRSAISHGKVKSISEGDFRILSDLTRSMIWAFIRDKELSQMRTFVDYMKWVNKRKYTCCKRESLNQIR